MLNPLPDHSVPVQRKKVSRITITVDRKYQFIPAYNRSKDEPSQKYGSRTNRLPFHYVEEFSGCRTVRILFSAFIRLIITS
jgi:hypothetical protein